MEVGDLKERLEEERGLMVRLEQDLVGAKALVQGMLIGREQGEGEGDGAGAVDLKALRGAQAALARAAKRDLKPATRLKALEQAKAVLGEVPEGLEEEVREAARGLPQG